MLWVAQVGRCERQCIAAMHNDGEGGEPRYVGAAQQPRHGPVHMHAGAALVKALQPIRNVAVVHICLVLEVDLLLSLIHI